MLRSISSLCFAAAVSFATAQDHQEYGWHIIEPGATYSVMLMSSSDLSYWMSNTPGIQQMANGGTLEANLKEYQTELSMMTGEVVFVTDHFKDKYICFDPLGRMVAFQGEGKLREAPMGGGAGVGHVQEDIELMSGDVIKKGSFIWVVAQDLAKGTITVQLAGGVKLEIPQAKVSLMSAQQRREVNEMKFTPVK